jgi:hypothetical protein
MSRKYSAIVVIRHKPRLPQVSACIAHAPDNPFSQERCMNAKILFCKRTNDYVPYSRTKYEDVIAFQLVLVWTRIELVMLAAVESTITDLYIQASGTFKFES